MLDKTVIDSATNGKYTEFSDSIKKELMGKMTNHPESQSYAKEIDKIHVMKQQFADITSATEEE
jgi:hypothetical protein